MIKEYRTIQEIASPLMVVDHVQGVTYDELAEVELTDGSRPMAFVTREEAAVMARAAAKRE